MKKIPFYNPASPLFFHIAILLLYALTLLLFFEPSMLIITLLFSASYPFFAIAIAIVMRKAYINTYQALVPEQFVDKLVLFNRYLITVIYIISLGVGFFESSNAQDGAALVSFFLLIISGLCFLFYLYILPIIIRLILLKKTGLILEIVILGFFFLLFLWSLYMINLTTNHYLMQRLYQILIF